MSGLDMNNILNCPSLPLSEIVSRKVFLEEDVKVCYRCNPHVNVNINNRFTWQHEIKAWSSNLMTASGWVWNLFESAGDASPLLWLGQCKCHLLLSKSSRLGFWKQRSGSIWNSDWGSHFAPAALLHTALFRIFRFHSHLAQASKVNQQRKRI